MAKRRCHYRLLQRVERERERGKRQREAPGLVSKGEEPRKRDGSALERRRKRPRF